MVSCPQQLSGLDHESAYTSEAGTFRGPCLSFADEGRAHRWPSSCESLTSQLPGMKALQAALDLLGEKDERQASTFFQDAYVVAAVLVWVRLCRKLSLNYSVGCSSLLYSCLTLPSPPPALRPAARSDVSASNCAGSG